MENAQHAPSETIRSSRVRMEAWRQWLLGGRKTLLCDKRTKTHYEPRILLTPTGLLMEGDYTPSKVADNPFGINRRYKRTFIAMGGPQAHGNSKPLNERYRLLTTNCGHP